MALRIHVGDDDLKRICPELEAELDELADSWPKNGRGRDGVVSDVNTDGTRGKLTSARGNFKHQRGTGKAVQPGALVLLFGRGFYRVASVESNVALWIETDGSKQSMAFKLTTGSALPYQVGGFAPQIQDAYEEVYNMPGMTAKVVAEASPLVGETEGTTLVDKALYCPDSWRGADALIKWGAMRLVLYMLQRGEDSVYEEKRKLAEGEWSSKREVQTFVYYDPPTYTEDMQSCSFTR